MGAAERLVRRPRGIDHMPVYRAYRVSLLLPCNIPRCIAPTGFSTRALSQLSDQGVLVFSSARQIELRAPQRLADMDA